MCGVRRPGRGMHGRWLGASFGDPCSSQYGKYKVHCNGSAQKNPFQMILFPVDTILGPYYGLDYVASATAIGGMYLVGNRNRVGLVLYAFSSLAMIAFASLANSPPILITNVVALALTIRAIRRWSHQG
jgi:hypothetical protein